MAEVNPTQPRKWISERDAEMKHRLPREMMAIWSGKDIFRPDDPLDCRVRRTVILRFYCARLGVDEVVMIASDGAAHYRPSFVHDLREMFLLPPEDVFSDKHQVARFQALTVLWELSGADSTEGFLRVLAEDAREEQRSPVGLDEIVQEWNRYELAT